MFVDIAKIKIKAGDGGNGAVAFHREKYINAGGLTVVTVAEVVTLFSKLMTIFLPLQISVIKENTRQKQALMVVVVSVVVNEVKI